MSIWTHVAGAMSCDDIDGILSPNKNSINRVKAIVGSWVGIDEGMSSEDFHDDSLENVGVYGAGPSMPSGSEGPMMFVVQRIGTKSSANNCLISFWGNLRDYGKEEVEREMIPWFKKLLKRLTENGVSCRAMSISIDVEGGKQLLLTINPNDAEHRLWVIERPKEKMK